MMKQTNDHRRRYEPGPEPLQQELKSVERRAEARRGEANGGNLKTSCRTGYLALAALAIIFGGTGPNTASAGGGVKTLRVSATPAPAARTKVQKGIASIYRDTRTASGERYCPKSYCAAHPTLPMGTKVKVTHAKSGRSVVVRINDRGPFMKGRIIDLTPAAATSIGLLRSHGITKVELSVVEG